MNDRECCGNCKYHVPDNPEVYSETKEWVCDNELSDCYAMFTGFDDECEDYEERDLYDRQRNKRVCP